MNRPKDTFRDAVFLITREQSCPIYSVGEELKIENSTLSISSYKPGCLYLARRVADIVSQKDSISSFPATGERKTVFDCGGCDGLIHFEYKKDKEFATLQMKLLKEADDRRRKSRLEKYFTVIRQLEIFKSLDDHSLSELTLMLGFKTFLTDKVIIKKGLPGYNLYIILSGRVAVIAGDGSTIAELGTGEVFGEMSLLTSEPVANTIHTIDGTEVAMLSVKNFRDILKKNTVLQLFLLKMLVDRAQKMTLRSGNIASGMTGELAEISTVDLFQLIHSSGKTGLVKLVTSGGKGMVFFRDGEIIYARFLDLRRQEAVYAMLGIKEGHFAYTRGIPAELLKAAPVGGFMALIIEGVQRVDEGGGSKDPPP